MSQSGYQAVDSLNIPLLEEETTGPTGFLASIGSLNLENKGAVARDHMANERTFLAWLRTSLSIVTIGIGIVQLLKLKSGSEDLAPYAKPLGASFVLLGIITLILGILRYFKVQSMLLSSLYPASQGLVSFLVGTVLILVVVTLALVFAAK